MAKSVTWGEILADLEETVTRAVSTDAAIEHAAAGRLTDHLLDAFEVIRVRYRIKDTAALLLETEPPPGIKNPRRKQVPCTVQNVDLEGDYGLIDGLCVTCTRCEHEVEVFGTSDRSVRRALVTLREECPRKEKNFYVTPEESE